MESISPLVLQLFVKKIPVWQSKHYFTHFSNVFNVRPFFTHCKLLKASVQIHFVQFLNRLKISS